MAVTHRTLTIKSKKAGDIQVLLNNFLREIGALSDSAVGSNARNERLEGRKKRKATKLRDKLLSVPSADE